MKIGNRGFTLLELSIVLIIISLILMASFESSKYFLIQNHIKSTTIKLNTIQNALDIYVIENGKLPCPAGLKEANGNSLSSCNSTNDSKGLYVQNGIARGAVPYNDLGLTKDNSFDAWRGKITYSVNVGATENIRKMKNDYDGITIYDNSSSNRATGKAIYSIVSHGKNKIGAFDGETNKQVDIGGASNSEKLNIAGTSTNPNEVAYFSNSKIADDIARYKTRLQLLRDTNIEDISCYITSGTISTLISNNSIGESPSFSIPSSNYLKYNQEIKSHEPEKYKIKCFRYGRLGIFSYE